MIMPRCILLSFLLVSCSLAQTPLRLVICGDSTVADYPDTTRQRGWGQYIQGYFKASVRVFNLAKGGRSTKTFLNEGLWTKALALKPDVILIQFGHNDSHDPKLPAATNAATDYANYLRQFVDEARAAGATPILITPVQRRTEVDSLLPYAEAMRKVAVEMHAPLIDLHASSGRFYRELGKAETAKLEANSQDRTHFNEAGARAIAGLVMKELPDLDPRLKKELK
jgi:lysophospholipase L1-like esterase